MGPWEGNDLLVTVSFCIVTPGGAAAWVPALGWHPAAPAERAARHASDPRRAALTRLVRLVDDCLRAVAEVKAIQGALVERDGAEEVPRNAPRRRAHEERAHSTDPQR